MSIETGIVATLAAAATTAASRIHPKVLPQGVTLPAITYQRLSTPRVNSHDGPSGLAFPRFQINTWAETYAAAKTLADEIRAALDGTTGVWDSVVVQRCELEDEGDLQPVAIEGVSRRRHGIRQDYVIAHQE